MQILGSINSLMTFWLFLSIPTVSVWIASISTLQTTALGRQEKLLSKNKHSVFNQQQNQNGSTLTVCQSSLQYHGKG